MPTPATFVPPSGSLSSSIAFVGEQPGMQEVRLQPRKPFNGPAGKELLNCMAANDLTRSECYFTNVIKDLDKPLAQYIKIEKKGVTVSPSGREYIEMLREELSASSANVIVAVGNVALYALTERTGITKWRGSIIESTLLPGRKVIPIIHPATVIPPKNVYTNRFLIITDLARVVAESAFPEIREHPMRLVIKPSFEEIINFLIISRNKGKQGHTIFLDIEVIGEINCISIAYDAHNCISIPFVDHTGDYMTAKQEIEVWKLIASILEHPEIAIGGQNIIFDLNFINRKFGIVARGPIHCTMIAQKILYPDFPVGLDFITSIYTRLPYYKADGKQWMNVQGGTWRSWWNYNARDSIACAIALPKQLEDLREQGNMETYERKMKIISPLMFMMEKGIKVDTAGLLSERDKTQSRINDLEQQIWDIVGYQINFNSPKQLQHYFYKEKGHKPYMKRTPKGWVPTVDELALKRLSRKGFEVAKLLLEIRGLSKRLGTYLDINKLSADSRIRCQYKPHGTKTGRLSSSGDIFGEGINQQNWPHDLLSYLIPDDGYIFYSFDLSQIENRIVAYVSRCQAMIEAFENDVDLHCLTAALLFNKPIEQVSSEEGSSPFSAKKSERDDGKRCKLRNCEVLTTTGWITIEDAYTTDAKIAQWNPKTNKINFSLPLSWYIDTYSGPIIGIGNKNFYQEGTPDHKMPIYYKDKDIFIDKSLETYPKSGHHFAPLSGEYSGSVEIDENFIRLLVAFQADGTWNNESMAIRVFKPRKRARLYAILRGLGIEYTENRTGINISSTSAIAKTMRLLLGKEKLFGAWLLELSGNLLDVFLSELRYWDGSYKGANQYFTSVRANAEWVQTIAHLRNKACNIGEQDNSKNPNAFGNKMIYRCVIRDTDKNTTSAMTKIVRKVFNEPILCPTMESGFFLVREKGVVSITGNCNHSLNYDFGYKSFALRFEMLERDAKWIVNRYHEIYPEVRNVYHKMVQNQLAKDRTLTNLFDRKRVFLGRWGDQLFKDAYAHIPQSTVADKMDSQAIDFIYSHQTLFRELDLLIQIHDSIGFQIPLSLPWIEHAKMLLAIQSSMATPLVYHDREFIVPVDLCVGLTLNKSDAIELKHKSINQNPEKFADQLRDIYLKLTKQD